MEIEGRRTQRKGTEKREEKRNSNRPVRPQVFNLLRVFVFTTQQFLDKARRIIYIYAPTRQVV